MEIIGIVVHHQKFSKYLKYVCVPTQNYISFFHNIDKYVPIQNKLMSKFTKNDWITIDIAAYCVKLGQISTE